MKRNVRRPRDRHGRWQPRCEMLEGRLVLTTLAFDTTLAPPLPSAQVQAALLQPIAVWPAGTLHRAIDSFAVGFNVALDPASLMQDLSLYRVRDDGSLALDDPVPIVAEQLDTTDPRWLVASLDGPLDLGHYRVVLSGGSMLTGIRDESGRRAMLDTRGVDLPLPDFTIVQPGTSRTDGADLGALGPAVRDVSGSLDFRLDPAAVSLTKFTLPAGADLYRLGLEVDAQRTGSPLRATLSLFDGDGHVLTTSHVGRPDFPDDPYLFAGLRPGTYYVGISAYNNQPGQPGGYDLATGAAGSNPPDQPGGTFTLRLAADVVTRPTTVIGFQLDRADPTRALPTGFEIQFSGPIGVTDPNGQIGPVVNRGLELVDRSGRSWPITAIGYDESSCRLTYLFDHQLPPGTYTIRLPKSDGLTDLAGQRVIRSANEPSAALATFQVAPAPERSAPNDLGPLFPAVGIAQDILLRPGETRAIRLVTLTSDSLRLTATGSGGPLTIAIDGAESQGLEYGPGWQASYHGRAYLQAGTHLVLLRASGDRPVQVHVTVRLEATTSPESLLLNGVGLSPALSLRMVEPTPSLITAPDATEPASTPTPVSSAASPVVGAAALLVVNPQVLPVGPAPTSPAPGGRALAAPGGLTLTLASAPVGLPGRSSDRIATVAPGLAMASQTGDASPPPTGPVPDEAPSLTAPDTPNDVAASTEGALQAAVAFEQDRRQAEGSTATLPEETEGMMPDPLADTAGISRGRRDPAPMLAEMVAADGPGGPESGPGESPTAAALPDPEPAEALSLDPINLIGFLTLAISPYRDRLARWLGRARCRAAGPRRGRLPLACTRSCHQPA